ncbi:DUF1489 family protein [Granulibacter bethesdensis]|uniref:DUF1489 family protein n=1 Tax=Granulibacter bethesdensis TaxID=364410 RepID=UPI00090ABA1B|nr:DUF1489 domain-containing protein [Granulibacter bethesdensis]APH60673.1 putative cytosolic protein [Granulibacter bethesdensis]
MLHLMKLAVGVESPAHLAALQSERARERTGSQGGELWHLTRQTPRQGEALLEGGSLYWVIGRLLSVRQPITGLSEQHKPDGTPCCAIHLAPDLIPVSARVIKPFQGWRYLKPEDAPPDLTHAVNHDDIARLPEPLRRELQALSLI